MTTQQGQADNQFKVKLVASTSTDRKTDRRRQVVFDVTPDLIENRLVNYKTLDPIHAPGQIYVYNSTASRTFNMSNIKLVSRTSQEATENLARLWTLRGWTMPIFGKEFDQALNAKLERERKQRNINDFVSRGFDLTSWKDRGGESNFMGRPPQVLLLSAYSSLSLGDDIAQLKRIPVVIQQLSISYPSDVDYIPTIGKNIVPMPTIMNLDMTLNETQSPSSYESFSLQEYREGKLVGF